MGDLLLEQSEIITPQVLLYSTRLLYAHIIAINMLGYHLQSILHKNTNMHPQFHTCRHARSYMLIYFCGWFSSICCVYCRYDVTKFLDHRIPSTGEPVRSTIPFVSFGWKCFICVKIQNAIALCSLVADGLILELWNLFLLDFLSVLLSYSVVLVLPFGIRALCWNVLGWFSYFTHLIDVLNIYQGKR